MLGDCQWWFFYNEMPALRNTSAPLVSLLFFYTHSFRANVSIMHIVGCNRVDFLLSSLGWDNILLRVCQGKVRQ